MIGEEVIAYYGDAGDGEELFEKSKLVRCKDCIHCADDWNGNEPQFTCELGRCAESVYPNDFCSYGERIDNE